LRGRDTAIRGAEIYGAVQNLMLAARKFGIGSTLTMLHTKKEREISRLLGIPKNARTMGIIPLGYPVRGQFSLPQRKPVATVTHWEKWGEHQPRSSESVRPSRGSATPSVVPAIACFCFEAQAALTPAMGLL
jgi:hypothetical protein